MEFYRQEAEPYQLATGPTPRALGDGGQVWQGLTLPPTHWSYMRTLSLQRDLAQADTSLVLLHSTCMPFAQHAALSLSEQFS